MYSAAPYGSQAAFSPLTVILNKGFDHLQADYASRRIWSLGLGRALGGAPLDALLHPVEAIERYPGWKEWLATEVLPLNFTVKDARWAVNYSEHMIAGGLTYRMLADWYEHRGFPYPRVLSAATTFGASYLNEAMEFLDGGPAASSTVADLYIFDLGGILLFNWDPLVRFFGGTLQATDWSTQASFILPDGELQNNGQYYIIKVPLPKTRTRLFARFGMGVQGGLSVPVSRELTATVASGVDTEVRLVDPATRDESIRTKLSGGVYVDRNNSLLVSLTASPTNNFLSLNVYPGVLPDVGKGLGTWLIYTRDKKVLWGIGHRATLGVGAGYSR